MEEDIKVVSDGTLSYRENRLFLEESSWEEIGERYGTPCYVYSQQAIVSRIKALQFAFKSFSPLLCYSIKANSNLSILRLMKRWGLGLDVVSEGELRRAKKAGFSGSKIVFAGAGKTPAEIKLAVRHKIFCFNVENEEELDYIEKYAAGEKWAVNCALRLNLDVDVKTHHYVKTAKKNTKFGLDLETAASVVARREKWRWAKITGIHFHLGSQIKEPSGYSQALAKVKDFCERSKFFPKILDIGGGFGIVYNPAERISPLSAFSEVICSSLKQWPSVFLILEPGRFLVGSGGFLLTRVLYVKKRGGKTFVIVDAAMNDLIRPSFYGSYHHIIPVRKKGSGQMMVDVVGPVCETGDYLAKERSIPGLLEPGDLVVVAGCGAYGFSMASNYNSRRRPCEVLVAGAKKYLIRKRESFQDLWRLEETGL